MIKCSNTKHFREAYNFAKHLGGKPKASFLHSIRLLNRLKRNAPDGMLLEIRPDFVRHSFDWVIWNPDTSKCWSNGGIILHGFEETYCVELSPEEGPHWSIHT